MEYFPAPLRMDNDYTLFAIFSGLSDIMAMMQDRPNQHVGIVGLGTGSLAAYARPNRRITFFEVDPQVLGIAQGFFRS
jgi:spermidine synthase